MKQQVVIIGAGPSGLSCALWLSNLGIDALVLEQLASAGGMLNANHHNNNWLLGFPHSTGVEIRERLVTHLQLDGIPVANSAKITYITLQKSGFEVAYSVAGKNLQIQTDYLVIATGMSPRLPANLILLTLQFPSRFLVGAGNLHIDRFSYGQRVAVLGGGDNAYENAYLLAKKGVVVSIYHRAAARARTEWRTRCENHPNITIHPNTLIDQFSILDGQIHFLANSCAVLADTIVVMYGYEPNTRNLRQIAPWIIPAMDVNGFIIVNTKQQTPLAGIYAIGDVTNHAIQCLPSAIGQGSVAAKVISLTLEANCV